MRRASQLVSRAESGSSSLCGTAETSQCERAWGAGDEAGLPKREWMVSGEGAQRNSNDVAMLAGSERFRKELGVMWSQVSLLAIT